LEKHKGSSWYLTRPKGDPKYFGGHIPWIKISDITKEPGKFLTHTEDTVTEEGALKSKLLPKGSLILSICASVCIPKILYIDGCIHDGFVYFPDLPKDINSSFLYYYFESIRNKVIQDNRQGMTQVNLNTGIVSNFNIPVPTISEQERIVEKIEELFTQLDAGTAALKRAQAGLKRYKASLLKAAVEGRLVPHNPSDEPAEEMLRRLGKEPLDGKDLPELPRGWCWVEMDEISDVIGGITKGRNLSGKEITSLPYLRVANVQRGYLNLSEIKEIDLIISEVEKYQLHLGDILLTEGGDWDKLGRAAIWKEEIHTCVHQNHIFRARINTTGIIPEWLMYYANSEPGIHYFKEAGKQTTNLASINLSQLKNFPIPLPPCNEQKFILSEIEKYLRGI